MICLNQRIGIPPVRPPAHMVSPLLSRETVVHGIHEHLRDPSHTVTDDSTRVFSTAPSDRYRPLLFSTDTRIAVRTSDIDRTPKSIKPRTMHYFHSSAYVPQFRAPGRRVPDLFGVPVRGTPFSRGASQRGRGTSESVNDGRADRCLPQEDECPDPRGAVRHLRLHVQREDHGAATPYRGQSRWARADRKTPHRRSVRSQRRGYARWRDCRGVSGRLGR